MLFRVGLVVSAVIVFPPIYPFAANELIVGFVVSFNFLLPN